MILASFGSPNPSQRGLKSIQKWSKFDLTCNLASRGGGLSFWNCFGSDLGAVREAILESKSASEAILEAFVKRSLIWYPSEVDFGLILNGFWPLIGGQKEGVNSKKTIIADPSKSLIVFKKNTIFTTSRDAL